MSHEHHHHEEGIREPLLKIIAATVLLVGAVIVEKNTHWAAWQYLLLYLPAYLVVGWDTLRKRPKPSPTGKRWTRTF